MKQPQPSVDLAPHEQQLGKYRLVAKLGQGGMGTVYLALATGLGAFRKLLVVKELRHDLPWRESSLGMFMDEAQLAARLDHPNVLQTFEAGEADGRYFLAMEYLDGQPLSAVIDYGLPLELHIYILCEVLQGLQYAHDLTDYDGTRLHVVHRDVSPQNVFVTYHGQVKVVDFGVAKANNGSNITSPGVFKGKFAYAAPEQLLSRPVDGRCDVFAVGVMLWEAIAGRRFGVPKPTVDAFRVRTQGLEPRIAQVSADVDPLLAEICDHALAIDPLQRIPSADAFRTRLQEWLHLQGEHIQSKQLAAHMQERFAEERANRRRVIEHAMIEAGASQSVIAALPQELYERESGMAAKVEPSELSNASGISPSTLQQTHSATPVRAVVATPQQASHTQGSVRLPVAAPERRAPSAKPVFRFGGVALLVCVAAGVFIATYQVSRRVTQEAPGPQLRAAEPQQTSSSHALGANAPAVPRAASDSLPAAATNAPAEPAREPSERGEQSQETAGARDRRAARDALSASDTSNALRDQAKRTAGVRDAVSTSDPNNATREQGQRASQRSAAAPATIAPEQGQRTSQRSAAAPATIAPEQGQRTSQRSAAPATIAADVAGGKSRGNARALTAETGQPSGSRAPLERNERAESERATTPAAKTRAAPSATRTDPSMGSDLRQLRSNTPMRIDVEDPYQ